MPYRCVWLREGLTVFCFVQFASVAISLVCIIVGVCVRACVCMCLCLCVCACVRVFDIFLPDHAVCVILTIFSSSSHFYIFYFSIINSSLYKELFSNSTVLNGLSSPAVLDGKECDYQDALGIYQTTNVIRCL